MTRSGRAGGRAGSRVCVWACVRAGAQRDGAKLGHEQVGAAVRLKVGPQRARPDPCGRHQHELKPQQAVDHPHGPEDQPRLELLRNPVAREGRAGKER